MANVSKVRFAQPALSYPRGVPSFIPDSNYKAEFLSNSTMTGEYEKKPGLLKRLKDFIYRDCRTAESKALLHLFDGEGTFLNIGGGPIRQHPNLINVNIGPFPNVDIVGDAHCLPIESESVDGVMIEAVLEHLHDAPKAIQEIRRVLKPGGFVVSITPFLQPYHGYPHHYQNLTLTGHAHYFSRSGFKVEASGTAVGPGYALLILNSKYILGLFPNPLSKLFAAIYLGVGMLTVKWLDLFINPKEWSHTLASSTYVHAVKS